jgi:hypothetical protein
LRPLSRGNDPTYQAIDAHRKARAAADVEIVKNDDLEAAIPKDKRKTRRHDEINESDDPHWLAHKNALFALFGEEMNATCELAEIVPTSSQGMLALLAYVTEVEQAGDSWPNLAENDNDR